MVGVVFVGWVSIESDVFSLAVSGFSSGGL